MATGSWGDYVHPDMREDGSPGDMQKPVAGASDSGTGEKFNPADHTVPEVLEYIGGVDDKEAKRVLRAEAKGLSRKGILGDDA